MLTSEIPAQRITKTHKEVQLHEGCDCFCSIAKESHSRNFEHSWITPPLQPFFYCHPWMES